MEEVLALGTSGWQKYDEVTVAGKTFHCYRKPKKFGIVNCVSSKS